MGSVAGIVLASGMSRRYGPENKLLVQIDGEPVVRRTVRAYAEAGLSEVIVVVGHEAEAVTEALSGLEVRTVNNPDFRQGQSRALVAGVNAAGGADAAIIGVADQPWLATSTIRTLVEAWTSTESLIVAPRFGGARGNPVLFAYALFAELLQITGDAGGRPVLQRHAADVTWVDVSDSKQGRDIDTPDGVPGS
jgi:molybdenum cofactor cytidylyltransferase